MGIEEDSRYRGFILHLNLGVRLLMGDVTIETVAFKDAGIKTTFQYPYINPHMRKSISSDQSQKWILA